MDVPVGAAGAVAAAHALKGPINKSVEACIGVINKICLPAAEQLGLMFGDKVSEWRAKNLIDSTRRLEDHMKKNVTPDGHHAHPRVVSTIVSEMTWIEDPVVQDMWAGLLASSCTESGDDDSNLIFVNLLSSLTKLQAKILNYACMTATKHLSPGGFITAQKLVVKVEDFFAAIGNDDIQRLDRELDSMRGMALFEDSLKGGGGGFPLDSNTVVMLTPSALALHMFIRANGSRKSPMEFYGLVMPDVSKREATPVVPTPTA